MIESHMLNEIREQPRLLDAVQDQAHRPWPAGEGRVFLLGCGDMDFAARTAAWMAGPPVFALSSMDMRWIAPSLRKGDLVVAASFSGRTPRTIEAACLAGERGADVLGITGNAGSPLTRAVEDCWVLDTGRKEDLVRHAYSGYHFNVPQTKTYTAVLMAELLLLHAVRRLPNAGPLGPVRPGRGLEAAMPLIERGVDRFMEEGFRPWARIVVLGSGPFRATADYGRAKFLEMAVEARSQCLEEINHLEMFLTRHDDLLIFLAPDTHSFSRAQEMVGPYERLGATRLIVAPAAVSGRGELLSSCGKGAYNLTIPDGDSWATLFILTCVLQCLAAAIGPALGRDIDQWVGGVRTDLIESLGQELVRRSKIAGREKTSP